MAKTCIIKCETVGKCVYPVTKIAVAVKTALHIQPYYSTHKCTNTYIHALHIFSLYFTLYKIQIKLH